MMIDPITFKEMHRNDTYAQLINEKAELMAEIASYENAMKRGGLRMEEMMIHPSPSVYYQMSLRYLSGILELMSEKYKVDDNMVDTNNQVEMYHFYIEVLWKAGEHFVTPKMKRDALRMLNRLAEDGYSDAMNDKGAMYYEGVYFKQNYKKAESWYKKAAEAGNVQSMANLGYMYFYGQGVKQSYELAYKYFSMAAMQEHPEGLNKLGDMYRYGIYILKDINMAMNCYIRANKAASIDKMSDAYPANLVRIAEMFMEGCLGFKNLDKAQLMLLEAREILEKQMSQRERYAKPVLERVNKNLAEIEKGLPAVDQSIKPV